MDRHDIIAFTFEAEKILGVVLEHYSNPLDDFYIVYADYSILRTHNPDEEAEMIMDNVIIPACDEALSEHRLQRQHLRDISSKEKEIRALIDAIKSKIGDIDEIFKDNT